MSTKNVKKTERLGITMAKRIKYLKPYYIESDHTCQVVLATSEKRAMEHAIEYPSVRLATEEEIDFYLGCTGRTNLENVG